MIEQGQTQSATILRELQRGQGRRYIEALESENKRLTDAVQTALNYGRFPPVVINADAARLVLENDRLRMALQRISNKDGVYDEKGDIVWDKTAYHMAAIAQEALRGEAR